MSRSGQPRRGIREIAGPVIAAAAFATLGTACGEPSAYIVTPTDSPISFEVPSGFGELEGDGVSATQYYGPTGSSSQQFGSDPVLSLVSIAGGENVSFVNLRSLAVGGRFDPLDSEDPEDPEAAEAAEAAEVIGYSEYGDSDIWGVRLRLLLTSGVRDFQALVDRRSDRITVSEMHCTQACFVEQAELIDQIQRSWSLES